eukprot:TRINITY_DN2019_c0_g1_i1.p1 TRINITY_DN2019_c0_g1~~TRINITY_DN2019_c0_g1_i1.p1  ORF type:complete len:230 (+),score=64.89 TRINITY_DN2019_c0_g1_i1:80-769(+)
MWRRTSAMVAVAATAAVAVACGGSGAGAQSGADLAFVQVLPGGASRAAAPLMQQPLAAQAVRPARVQAAAGQAGASSSFAGSAAAVMALVAIAGAGFARQQERMRGALALRRLRLAGKEVPRNKELAWGIASSVFGIGKATAFQVCKDAGVDPHKRPFELSEEEELRLVAQMENYTLENPLRRMYKANCQLLLEIKHRRGIRMQKGLPVRFQRSKTNNRSARVLNPWRL